VYFVHGTFFHHHRDFSQVYKDRDSMVERDAGGLMVPEIPQQDLYVAGNLNNRVKH